MKTIIVDDEKYSREHLLEECVDLADVEIIREFESPVEALAYARQNRVELAFLDVEMPIMNGLELSDQLRGVYPDMIVIFVSAHDCYMPDALSRRGADYYLVKPYTRAEIEAVVKRAKLLSKRFAKRIYIETFGRFNIYLDGVPINFTSMDAKELLALMVDRRGTALENREAFGEMWGDKPYENTSASSLHKALRKLKDTLDNAGIGDLLVRVSPNEHRVDTDLFDCDYYQFLNGDQSARQKFAGKYMANWTWGEDVAVQLIETLRASPDANKYAHLFMKYEK